MSSLAIVGSFFVAASLAFMVVAFGSPYWVESFEEFKGTFVKLGLWEFCFNDYTFYNDYDGRRYLGCFYVFSDTLRPIWEWVSPPWFISVEVLISCSLLFIFLCAVVCTLYIFKMFPKHVEYTVLLGLAAAQCLSAVLIFIALVVFGVKKEDRDWMPRPDMNLLSWSYGLAVMSCFCSLVAAIVLGLESRTKYKDMQYYQPPVTTYT